jgi:hypothetical protein
VKFIAFVLVLSLTTFYAEVLVLPLTQCSAVQSAKMDNCSKCAGMHAKNTCKNADKKHNDGCNKNTSCFNCPLCSAFLPFNFHQSQTIQVFHKTIYSLYKDNIISAYVSETWKPPNTRMNYKYSKLNSFI